MPTGQETSAAQGIPTIGTDMAFPCMGPNVPAYGLTKRELLAAMAMQGMIGPHFLTMGAREMAKEATAYADALIEALS